MRALDITAAQAERIARAAISWKEYGRLNVAEFTQEDSPFGETFGEWLARYLDAIAPESSCAGVYNGCEFKGGVCVHCCEPAPPSIPELERAMRIASEDYGHARRAFSAPQPRADTHTVALAHAKLIAARASLIGARAMADAKKVTT